MQRYTETDLTLTITKDNIDHIRKYTKGPKLGVKIINWEAGELDPTILKYFPDAHTLICSNNGITDLEPTNACLGLMHLDCRNNLITDLSPLVFSRQLRLLQYSGNPLAEQTIQVHRFIEIVEDVEALVLNNRLALSNTEFRRPIRKSVQVLLADPEYVLTDAHIMASQLASIEIKQELIRYRKCSRVHIDHLITYSELLSAVWRRIEQHDERAKLFELLSEQIAISMAKDKSGLFFQTLYVLKGYFSDLDFGHADDSSRSILDTVMAAEERIDLNSDDAEAVLKQMDEIGRWFACVAGVKSRAY